MPASGAPPDGLAPFLCYTKFVRIDAPQTRLCGSADNLCAQSRVSHSKDLDMSDFPDWKNESARPGATATQTAPINIAIDAEVASWFQERGMDLQPKVNELLREYIEVNRQNPAPDL
jgi:uncharacterized protein (DUF4415 family)